MACCGGGKKNANKLDPKAEAELKKQESAREQKLLAELEKAQADDATEDATAEAAAKARGTTVTVQSKPLADTEASIEEEKSVHGTTNGDSNTDQASPTASPTPLSNTLGSPASTKKGSDLAGTLKTATSKKESGLGGTIGTTASRSSKKESVNGTAVSGSSPTTELPVDLKSTRSGSTQPSMAQQVAGTLESRKQRQSEATRATSKKDGKSGGQSPQSNRSRKPGGDILNAEFCERIEYEVLEALSFVRQEPDKVIEMLERKRKYFKGEEYSLGPGRVLMTEEGVEAVDDAIRFLKKQKPLGPIEIHNNPGLKMACADHVHDNGTTGSLKHSGSDGSKPHHRVTRYGKWHELCGECLWFGSCQSGLEMILDLIIDDGVADRGHRICIYTPSYTMAGVKLGPHSVMEMMLGIDFVNGYDVDPVKVKERLERGPKHVDPSKIPQFDRPDCIACDKPIIGPIVESKGGKYHRDCFCCSSCGTVLVGVPCITYQNRLLCVNCAPKNVKIKTKSKVASKPPEPRLNSPGTMDTKRSSRTQTTTATGAIHQPNVNGRSLVPEGTKETRRSTRNENDIHIR